MRILITLAILLFSVISCSDPVENRITNIENSLIEFSGLISMFQADTTNDEDLKTLAQRMDHYKVPAVSMVIIDDYELDWAKSYGVLKVGSDRAIANDTYFQAASTSKLVTTSIVLHFVERGLFGLDEDVNDYLKSWKIPESDFTRERKVTLRLLITHQAGLPVTNFPQEENAGDPTLIQVLNGESPAMNKPAVVEYVPGTKWQYSNLGFVVIQQILEDMIGKPFSQIARETVFEPLGMENSTFAYPLSRENQSREAIPHDAEGMAHAPELPPTALAQGGLLTTPSDLALFAIELMNCYNGLSTQLMSQEMVRQMFTKELDLDPKMFGMPLGQSLGAMIYGKRGNFVFAHPGSNFPGMNCWLVGHPQTGKGAVIMTNGAMGEVLAMELISSIVREYEWPIREL
jgi:CubicO group peptidase (beta-lactamase class C family)